MKPTIDASEFIKQHSERWEVLKNKVLLNTPRTDEENKELNHLNFVMTICLAILGANAEFEERSS